jgi:hypothetical protein
LRNQQPEIQTLERLIVSKPSPLTAIQRSALVLLLHSKEDDAENLAGEARVSEATIYRWREAFTEGSTARL